MSKSLPSRPNLEQLKHQAKDLLKQFLAGEPVAVDRVREFHPKRLLSRPSATLSSAQSGGEGRGKEVPVKGEQSFRLHDAQLVIAREYGFASWPKLKEHIESIPVETGDPLELLKKAFQADDAVLFRKLLDRFPGFKARINEPIGPFDSPAITNVRSREMLDVLLDHGADIDARDVDHESTPAQWMVRDRQEIARHLVQRGCKTDLLMAGALGDVELLRKHLDADPGCIHLRVSDEYFPMINPKSGGSIYQWALGWYVSPHDVAKQFGHDEAFRLLMERSPADVKLIAACWVADEATVKSLLANHAGLVAHLSAAYGRQVAHAARNNNLAAVRVMLAAGLPVDALGQHRATPLHWAAFHGNAEMTREILRSNPPLELTDADFQGTPLGWAIHGSEHGWYCRTGNYAATVEMLVKAGAKLPEKKTGGTEAVKEVLRQYGAKDED